MSHKKLRQFIVKVSVLGYFSLHVLQLHINTEESNGNTYLYAQHYNTLVIVRLNLNSYNELSILAIMKLSSNMGLHTELTELLI